MATLSEKTIGTMTATAIVEAVEKNYGVAITISTKNKNAIVKKAIEIINNNDSIETPTPAKKAAPKTAKAAKATHTRTPKVEATDVTITKALYGIEGVEQIDITDKVSVGIGVNNKLVGSDPVPGKKKKVTVTATVNGEEVTKNFAERQPVIFYVKAEAPAAEETPAEDTEEAETPSETTAETENAPEAESEAEESAE